MASFTNTGTTDAVCAAPDRVAKGFPGIRSLLDWVIACDRRSRERNELRRLGPLVHKDLGGSRTAGELNKPFWVE